MFRVRDLFAQTIKETADLIESMCLLFHSISLTSRCLVPVDFVYFILNWIDRSYCNRKISVHVPRVLGDDTLEILGGAEFEAHLRLWHPSGKASSRTWTPRIPLGASPRRPCRTCLSTSRGAFSTGNGSWPAPVCHSWSPHHETPKRNCMTSSKQSSATLTSWSEFHTYQVVVWFWLLL